METLRKTNGLLRDAGDSKYANMIEIGIQSIEKHLFEMEKEKKYREFIKKRTGGETKEEKEDTIYEDLVQPDKYKKAQKEEEAEEQAKEEKEAAEEASDQPKEEAEPEPAEKKEKESKER